MNNKKILKKIKKIAKQQNDKNEVGDDLSEIYAIIKKDCNDMPKEFKKILIKEVSRTINEINEPEVNNVLTIDYTSLFILLDEINLDLKNVSEYSQDEKNIYIHLKGGMTLKMIKNQPED